jgi:hypothetical protein
VLSVVSNGSLIFLVMPVRVLVQLSQGNFGFFFLASYYIAKCFSPETRNLYRTVSI